MKVTSNRELRSGETKNNILSSAGKLFAERGFDAVTMREIAKEAGCSHTTIYIHFKDKETLLHHLSVQPLEMLKKQFEEILIQNVSAENKLKSISRTFIQFCLLNRNMYTIFFNVKAGQVDDKEPELEINQLRNELFGLLMKSLRESLQIAQEDTLLLSYSRIFFFTLQGIVGTYTFSKESPEELMERLGTTFDEAVEVLLIGFKSKLGKKENS